MLNERELLFMKYNLDYIIQDGKYYVTIRNSHFPIATLHFANALRVNYKFCKDIQDAGTGKYDWKTNTYAYNSVDEIVDIINAIITLKNLNNKQNTWV
jgi:hypothetical protein